MTRSADDLIVRMGEPPAPVSRVGGKGYNLSLLAHHGIRVPPFLVLTTAVFERLAGDLLPALDELAASAAQGAPPAQVAEQLQTRVLTASFDAETERAIAEAVGELIGGRDRLLAVRSSAIDEDSDEHSFAGQLDSYLFQRAGSGLLTSVKRCLASAFNERALVYRLAHGLPASAIRAAVVIQEMVEAEVAGVAFTANPIGGNPEQRPSRSTASTPSPGWSASRTAGCPTSALISRSGSAPGRSGSSTPAPTGSITTRPRCRTT